MTSGGLAIHALPIAAVHDVALGARRGVAASVARGSPNPRGAAGGTADSAATRAGVGVAPTDPAVPGGIDDLEIVAGELWAAGNQKDQRQAVDQHPRAREFPYGKHQNFPHTPACPSPT